MTRHYRARTVSWVAEITRGNLPEKGRSLVARCKRRNSSHLDQSSVDGIGDLADEFIIDRLIFKNVAIRGLMT